MIQYTTANEHTDLENSPHTSLIVPFTEEMRKRGGLLKLLASATDKAGKELMIKYPKDQATLLINQLREAIEEVTAIPNEKTLAIFVSRFAKKIYFFTPTKRIYMPSVLVKSTE